VTHEDHAMYQEKEAFHEAGYDSLLTATILIRLGAKLGAERKKQHPSPNVLLNGTARASNEDLQDFVRDGREKVQKPVALPPVANLDSPVTGRQKRKQKKKPKSKEATERRFQTKNMFDNLRDMSLNPEDAVEPSSPESEPAMDFEDAEASTPWNEQPAAQAGSWENALFVQDKSGWVPIEQCERHAMELIPTFDPDSAFWKEFGNTLRVFGTQEAVLKIADW
jgi:poly(A)-specific ribonuclease